MVNKKKTVDNWKKKKWYDVLADENFDNKKISEIIALNSKNIINKKIKKSLNELTGNIRDSHTEITFRIKKVTATTADTEICKVETKKQFLRRLIRRDKSKIENIFYINTKDNRKIKIKVLFISGKKYTKTQKTESLKIMEKYYKQEFKEKTIKEAWHNVIHQTLNDKCKKELVKIGYINKIIISKATLIN